MACNILIVFYSRTGSVERLAAAMAEGAGSAGAEVRLRRVREIVAPAVMEAVPGWAEAAARMNAAYAAPAVEDADWADGLLLGTPTRFGAAASELRAWLDGLGALWVGNRLVDKAGGAFTSTSTRHGGAETTVLSLYPTLAHLGLVIVPNGYGAPRSRDAGTPYGSSSVSFGPQRLLPTDEDLEIARHQGRRTAEVAASLRALRESRG